MRTIIDNAESVLQAGMERANDRRKVELSARRATTYDLFTIRSYVLHEARSNSDFFNGYSMIPI